MPVAACQLVITTASESHALVGELAFADHLPLAASGVPLQFMCSALVWRQGHLSSCPALLLITLTMSIMLMVQTRPEARRLPAGQAAGNLLSNYTGYIPHG